jgi:hypothetical protein
MITLPLTKSKNGCYYTQIHRTARTALYSLAYSPKGKVIGFEVFKIRIAPARTLPNGVPVPEQEHFPSNEEFGKIAWSFTTQRTAMKKFEELEANSKS